MAKLVIVRGIPGAGKSTKAREIIDNMCGYKVAHLEADMFFTKETGEYNFDAESISRAHNWCLDTVKVFLRQDYVVVVANTFTMFKEVSPYIEFAVNNDFEFEVITMTTDYGSIHGVPEIAMQRMRDRFVPHSEFVERCNNVKKETTS